MAIEWNHDLMTTGSDEIDADHKEWIKRFNQFDSAVVERKGLDVISDTLQYFSSYSETHFPHEEAIMDLYQCPTAAVNRAEHDAFRRKLGTMMSWIQTQGASIFEVIELKLEMENWLKNHICVIDASLRSVNMQRRDSLNPPETALPGAPISSLDERLNQAILQSSPDVVLLIDSQGTIIYISGRVTDLLGYQSYELLGKSVENLVPAQFSRHSQMREAYQMKPITKAMSNRPVLTILHKSGSQVPVDIALSPLPPIEGYPNLFQAVIRDAAPRWSSQQDLIIQSVAMNAAANGIVITDAKGVIKWVNPAVTRMTGYTESELIGSTPRMLKSGKHDQEFYKILWETVLSGRTWYGEIINRRKDGTLYYEEQHIAPVLNNQGQITSLIAIKQDVTSRRQAELKLKTAHEELSKQYAEIEHLAKLLNEANQALEAKVAARTTELAEVNQALVRANDQLKELDNLKSSFLSVISHELRTPFASILLTIQLLSTDFIVNADPEEKQLLQQLFANIESANAMINNLVNYAEFIRKQGVLNLNAVKPGEVLENIFHMLVSRAERKKIKLTCDCGPGLPMIYADEDRLINAIYELVDNAIKFTPSGGTIEVRAWSTENNMLAFAVHDTGIGVQPERLPDLWESFSQIADPIRRGREGLGLGLALVKYIVEAHKGTVWAESKQGSGSTFGFQLPIENLLPVSE